jgi:alkylhydroperoxidase/carboxymuconolactone decarboxylase family protein YurZ
MAEHPLEVFRRIDPAFFEHVDNAHEFALGDGVLSKKFKFLIAMALDSAAGTVDGVKSLAQAAINAGATKEEINETLRVAQYISGVGTTYTAGRALTELL